METNERTVTVEDVLADVRRILGDIDVPVQKLEQIGMPISKAINGIDLCLEAFQREREASAKEEPVDIDVSFVPEDEVPEEIKEQMRKQ